MRPHETETEMLQRYLRWLQTDVLKGYQRRKDTESIRRTKRQIADIEYRLETNPPRPRPDCGWTRPLQEHPAHDSDVVLKTTGKHGRIHSKACFRGVTEAVADEDTQDTE